MSWGVLGCLGGVLGGSCGVLKLLGGLGRDLGWILAGFWSQHGAILEPCWAFFEPFLVALLLSSFKIFSEAIFGRFLIDFRPLGGTKTLKNQWFFNIFAFFASSLLRPILDRFWVDFGTQNRPKMDPESDPKRH